MIEIQDLRKTYGKTVAVRSVSFSAPNGLVTGLLGPNGAGKTTALRAVTGLITPDAGCARVDEVDVGTDPLRARSRLGVLPESAGLYGRLTVREHVLYAGRLHGLRQPGLDARADALLDQFGLAAEASRPAAGLSLGQRRRVALMRALVHQPANVILDEPTNGLDVLGAREVRREARRLADAGCAVVFASHVMPDVSAICDRIVVLSQGAVVAAGTPAEILAATGCSELEDAVVRLIGSAEGLN